MADIFVAAGGGGGVSSDELTARAEHVLAGEGYVGVDTDDEAGVGTMSDNGSMQKTLRAGESVTVPRGFHDGSGTVTAVSLAEQTVGDAAPGDIVAGCKSWVRGARITGTLVEREGEQPTTGVTISDGLAHVGMLPGAYRKNGRYGTPEIKAPVDVVARAAGLDGTKMLQGYAPLGVPGQIPVIDTGAENSRAAISDSFGLDHGNGTFWINSKKGNAYYMRSDGVPHMCIEAAALGNAIKEQVLQGARFSCAYGINIEGTIPTWRASGDIGGQKVIAAFQDTVFAGDYGARGRGIFMRILGGVYTDPAAMWCFAPMSTIIGRNIRKGVSICGQPGELEDYAASCVPFDGARFDGVHLSGWADGDCDTSRRFRIGPTGRYQSAQTAYARNAILTPYGDGEPALLVWLLTPSVALQPFRRALVTVSYSTNTTIMGNGNGVNLWAGFSRINGVQRSRTLEPIREAAASYLRAQSGRAVLEIPLDGVTEQGFLVVAAHGSNFRQRGGGGVFDAHLERIELIA